MTIASVAATMAVGGSRGLRVARVARRLDPNLVLRDE
jgi:hypothetical protein